MDMAIADGVADQMEEYADFDDWVPGLAEILMVAAYGSHWDGSYCGGTVGQQSIAVMDWGRLAVAFMEVYD